MNTWKEELDRCPMLRAGVNLICRMNGMFPDSTTYIVGGTVRDILLGRRISDVDIATNVDLSLIEDGFICHDIGKSKDFGIVTVKMDDFDFEVAHFREDIGASDGRHPDSIKDTSSFEIDSRRRDFTINAMAIDVDGKIIDFHNGQEDLEQGLLRTVGDPKDRFTEDLLRVYRLFRFSAVLDFGIDISTKSAARAISSDDLMDKVSTERIINEMYKAAKSGEALASFIEQLDGIGLLDRLLPELVRLKGMEQSPIHHPEGDCYVHTICAVRASKSYDPITNIAVLFHDLGKAVTYKSREGRHTYYGHEAAGVPIVRDIAKRLKISSDDLKVLEFACKQHMNGHRIGKQLSKPKVIRLVNDPHWTQLKDVIYADEMSRGDISDPDGYEERMKYAEELAEELNQGKGPEGLKTRLRSLINGTILMGWIPQLNETGNKPFIGDIIQTTHHWIINNDNFDVTSEDVRSFAVRRFNHLLRTKQ
jgi:tRNA nucleotidyltransferase (CCA-adding enzyme)